MAQDGIGVPQDGPKTLGWPLDDPKLPEDSHKMTQSGPKSAQD